MRNTWASMKKEIVMPMLGVIALCPSLERMCLGTEKTFKEWQCETVEDLLAMCLHLVVG